jgi:hypothetical protein
MIAELVGPWARRQRAPRSERTWRAAAAPQTSELGYNSSFVRPHMAGGYNNNKINGFNPHTLEGVRFISNGETL